MKTLSRDSVVSVIREAAHEEYALSDKLSGEIYGDAGVQRVVNEIVRFFAERIINKIDAQLNSGTGEHTSRHAK